MSYSTHHSEYLAPVIAMTHAAGRLIMGYYKDGFDTSHKADDSPVTNADIAANQLITEALKKLTPDILVIAEEDSTHDSQPMTSDLFWLVDPLDGTRAFVRGEPEFTVNIALIQHGTPILGVILAPAQELLYYGGETMGAFREIAGGAPTKIQVRPKPADGLTVVRSKSHPSKRTEEFLATLAIKELIAGSSSVKFCQVAEGSADIYPRFGRTMEWDTAAGHAILNAAGGRVETAEGEVLRYGKTGFENPHFIALSSSDLIRRSIV